MDEALENSFCVIDALCENCSASKELHFITRDLGDGVDWKRESLLCTSCLVELRNAINDQLSSRAFSGEEIPE